MPLRTRRTDVQRELWNSDTVAEIRSLQGPGDEDLVGELLASFRSESRALALQLHVLSGRHEFEAVHEVAHRLRGAALNLGAERLAYAAALVEDAAERRDARRLGAFVAVVLLERERFVLHSAAH